MDYHVPFFLPGVSKVDQNRHVKAVLAFPQVRG